MLLTLNLTPDMESRLRKMASLNGRSPEEYISSLLDGWLREDAREFDAAVAGIRRGMADAAAGREISLEDYRARLEAEQGWHQRVIPIARPVLDSQHPVEEHTLENTH